MKKLLLTIILGSILFQCGNPAIVRYIKPVFPVGGDIGGKIRKFAIYQKNGVQISIQSISGYEFQSLLKSVVSDNAEFRTPPLSYLLIEIENKSEQDFSIDLFKTSLHDEDSGAYHAITRDNFEKMFTSVSYSNLKFDTAFSFYITRFNGSAPPAKNAYFKRIPAENAVILQPGYGGFQIIPLEFITEQSRTYNLDLEFPDGNMIVIPVEYVVYRSDTRSPR